MLTSSVKGTVALEVFLVMLQVSVCNKLVIKANELGRFSTPVSPRDVWWKHRNMLVQH